MRILLGILMAWSLLAQPAGAQVQVQMTMHLPVVLPPMVVVQPGVRVVSELDEEVYFVDGWYWVRRGPHWYRTHDHRGLWVWVVPARVPATLVRIPPGRYRRLHREEWMNTSELLPTGVLTGSDGVLQVLVIMLASSETRATRSSEDPTFK